jgi:hypothetical protein
MKTFAIITAIIAAIAIPAWIGLIIYVGMTSCPTLDQGVMYVGMMCQ